ncbi:MAG: hypothetical protein R3F34_11990 [Planctomycetota bacterium]
MSLRPRSLEHGDRLVARAVFWILLGVLTVTFTGAPGDQDRVGELHYQTTRSIALGQGLVVGDETPEGRTLLSEGFRVVPTPHGGVAQVEPMAALTGVPFYWAGSAVSLLFPGIEQRNAESSPGFAGGRSEYFAHLFVGWRGPLFVALAAWIVCLASLRLGVGRAAGFLCSLALGLSTYMWPASTSWGSGAQAALFAAASLYALLLVRDRFYQLRAPGPWHWLFLGAALGAAVATQPLFLPASIALATSAVRMTVRGRKRLWSMPLLKGEAGAKRTVVDLVWFAIPVAVAGALWWWGQDARTGGAGIAPWVETWRTKLLAPSQWPAEVAGVLASPGKGIFWLAPLVVLAPFGWYRFRKELRLLAFTLLAPLLALSASAAFGEWVDVGIFEPLGTLPALVLVWPAVASGVDALRSNVVWRSAAVALGCLGTVTNVGGVLVSRSAWLDVVTQAQVDLAPTDEEPAPGSRAFAHRVAWDWRTAAPWVGWRMVRHRTAAAQGGFASEVFPSAQVVLVEGPHVYRTRGTRDVEFRHLAWVDLEERLSGAVWPVLLLVLVVVGLGGVQAASGLDPACP